MNRFLITGGSGFIGTNLISYLQVKFPGCSILNLDISPPRNVAQNIYYNSCDINDLQALSTAVNNFSPDYLFHLAASTGVGNLPLASYKTNISGVENIISAARNSSTLQRIIFASSLLVCKVGYIPDNDNEYVPSTPYGISKMKGEIIVKTYASDLDWVIVRPISIWGPWNTQPYIQFFQSVLKGFYFHLGSRKSTRSLGYVENTVFQLVCLIKAPSASVTKKIFYLADYEPASLRTMATQIATYRFGPRFIPTLPLFCASIIALIGDIVSRYSKRRFPLTSFRLNNLLVEYIFDLSKLHSVCGELPFTNQQGIQRTISHIRNSAYQ
jgi:nucleoside-diphosphate-sugar epimerase